jgi:hypothetical protein
MSDTNKSDRVGNQERHEVETGIKSGDVVLGEHGEVWYSTLRLRRVEPDGEVLVN